jgi:hypothetical protein
MALGWRNVAWWQLGWHFLAYTISINNTKMQTIQE